MRVVSFGGFLDDHGIYSGDICTVTRLDPHDKTVCNIKKAERKNSCFCHVHWLTVLEETSTHLLPRVREAALELLNACA